MRPDETRTDPLTVRDKALNLRESVNSARAGLSAQRAELERLRASLSEMRALIRTPLPSAPRASAAPPPLPARRAAVPPPLPPVRPSRPAPVAMEAAADSARVVSTASFEPGARAQAWRLAPYALLMAVAVGLNLASVPERAGAADPAPSVQAQADAAVAALPAVPDPAPRADASDDGAEALLLVHEWRLPGDDAPLSSRLGPSMTPPGARPAWTAERTGDRTYRVSYRPDGGRVEYDFDVDLDDRRVDPTPDTERLLAPRLVTAR